MHTNETVKSHYKAARHNHQDIVGRLDHLSLASSKQNNLIGNIVVTESGNVQQMMGVIASRLDEMSESKIKDLIETTMKTTLENFLSSGDRMDFRTQDGQNQTLGPASQLTQPSERTNAPHPQSSLGIPTATRYAPLDHSRVPKLIRPTERRSFRQQLLTGLEYEDSVLEQDVEAKLQTIWTLPRQDQDRVVAIMRSHKLQTWITNTHSSALLINANHRGSTKQQPTSFICAKLLDSIALSPSHASLPLAFFCGEHLQPDDPDSGPAGMMRSLLAQLLLAYPDFDLATIQQLQQLNFDDVADLCDVFDLLVAQLPRYMVVFCVLDAVSFFEDDDAVCEEASVVVQALVDVVERTREVGCAFKLLLMSPWNSRILYSNMCDQERDVVWLPAKVPPQGGFTALKWNASVESGLRP